MCASACVQHVLIRLSCFFSCCVCTVQVATLFNLLACDEAEPAQGALSWPVKEELYEPVQSLPGREEKAGAGEGSTNGDAQAQPSEQRLKEILGIDDATAKRSEGHGGLGRVLIGWGAGREVCVLRFLCDAIVTRHSTLFQYSTLHCGA